jgi:hypothetical protein
MESQRSQPTPSQPTVTLSRRADYRENYANSVQVRSSLWDFFLSFGTLEQQTPERVSVSNFQGVFLSPQQAKALFNVLRHNLSEYEAAFGEIRIEARPAASSVQ